MSESRGQPQDHGDTSYQWRARAYRPGDEALLVTLFEEVFHRPMSEDHWRWKLKVLPSPVENVAIAVDRDDRPVFHIAGIPCRYQLAGRDCTVMVAVDAMTAPNYRRQGLLTRVGQQLFESWRTSGIAMALGLPNEQYNKAVLRWQRLFSLKWLIRPLRPERLLARRLRLPGLSRFAILGRCWNTFWDPREIGAGQVRIREIGRAGPEFDELWNACRSAVSISVVRDSSWVNWRYLAAPHRRYRVLLAERRGQPAGYATYFVTQSAHASWGLVADLFAPAEDSIVIEALVAEILRRMELEGADAVATLAVPETELYRRLRRAGFLFTRGSFSVECAPFEMGLTVEALRVPQSWWLVGGDFDVI